MAQITKSDLQNYRKMIDEIERMTSELESLRGGLSPRVMDDMPRTMREGDPVTDILIRIDDLQERKKERLADYLFMAAVVEDAMKCLEADERRVISIYYLDPLPPGVVRITNAYVARTMHYSESWVEQTKSRATKRICGGGD